VCPECAAPLELVPERPSATAAELRTLWSERRSSIEPADRSGVWRFRELLAGISSDVSQIVTLGEGNTPVLRGLATGRFAGVTDLYIKHLGWNPTGSFKDLGMTAAVTRAVVRGATFVACASTGNTAASMAAYAVRAGLKARVFLPGSVAAAKVAQAEAYGAELVRVGGNFDDALSGMLEGADESTYVLNSLNPFRVEGQKTFTVELMEQLAWKAPDVIALPGGNLGNVSAVGVALADLFALGLIDRMPRVAVIQAKGANPFVRMWQSGSDYLTPLKDPKTIATAIRIGAPVSWRKAMRTLTTSNGTTIDVPDDEIAEARQVIGRDGIGCELGSAAALAGIRSLRRSGWIGEDERVICILTGHLLKEPGITETNSSKPRKIRSRRVPPATGDTTSEQPAVARAKVESGC
jgi:threonine synthase